jgi:hypothetical protein
MYAPIHRRPAAAFCLMLMAVAAMAATPPAPPKAAPSPLTLEQAVAQVQSQTHGAVLQADARQLGRVTEYRIKVLTPDGHVRVVPVRTKAAKKAADKATTDKEKR